MNKQLILLDKNTAFSKLPSMIRQDDLCYILSKDYLSYLKLNKILPDGCKVLNLAGKFQKEIKILRKAYLELFVTLSKKYDSMEWWGTQLASRNSSSIPLQLNIIYLFCAETIFNSEEGNKRIIIIADSQALLDSISMLAVQKNFTVIQPRKRIRKIALNVKLIFLYILKIIIFLWRCHKNRRLAFSVLEPFLDHRSLAHKKIVIRSWVTKDTLNEDGVFTDRNFGVLPEWLQSKGYEVIMLPMFFNLDKPLKNTYLLMKHQNVPFLIQYHYLTLIDYFKALYIGSRQINITIKHIMMESLDLTMLFREIQLQEGFNPSLLTLNLCYPLLKRLKKLGFKIEKFYYPFENNVPEKLYILGCKKYFPDSEIIAYQHTVWYKDQLGMFLSKDEVKYHPIADKIICSGPIYLDVLKKAGFPENRLVAGPNLRFTSVYRPSSTFKQEIKRPNILLPLTFDNDLAYDLVHKVKIILKDFPELSVYIRRHPLLNENELEIFLNEINMINYQYADDGSIQDWLSNTDMVITTGGSVVILETVVMGVPLIRVKPDNNIFLDPLAWTDYPIKPVNSPAEIKSSIDLIMGEKKDKDKLQSIGKDVLFNYFTEINENSMKDFC